MNQSFGQYGVRLWAETSGTVTGQAAPGGGPNSVADPRIEGKPRFNNTFRVVPYGGASPTVAGPGGPAGGFAVADPRAPDGRHTGGKYRVTSYDMTANAVIGASTTGMGAFVVADPRCTWNANSHRNKLRVVSTAEPTGCVTTSDRVGSGAMSVADPMPRGLSSERRLAHSYNSQAHYGVMGWSDTSISVPGHAKYDRGRWSVAEPRDVPIADMPVALPKPEDRLVARIIALDDTWHRPLTTLDLAALMGFYDPEEAFPNATGADPAAVFPGFELVGRSDAMKREWTGNAVPPPAARGIAETIGEAFLLAEMGETFTLSNSDIWVKQGALALAVDNRQPAFGMDDVSDVLAGMQ